MPKKNARATVDAVDPETQEAERPGGLEELLPGLPPGDFKISIFEAVPGEPEKFLRQFDPDPNLLDIIGKKYGGGEYVWRIKKPDGRYVSRKADGFQGQGRFALSEREYPRPSLQPPVAAPPRAGTDLFMMMFEQQRASADSQMKMFQVMMQQQTSILTALISKSGDPVQQVKALHEMAGGGTKGTLGETLELLEVAKGMVGGGARRSKDDEKFEAMERIAGMVVPVIDKAIDRAWPRRPSQAPQRSAAGALPPGGRPPVTAEVESQAGGEGAEADGMTPMQKMQLAKFINSLVPMAARGSDPELYADVFLDQVDRLGIPLDQVRAAINDPGMLDALEGYFPGVRQHRAWFEGYVKAVREGMNAPATPVVEDVADDATGKPVS